MSADALRQALEAAVSHWQQAARLAARFASDHRDDSAGRALEAQALNECASELEALIARFPAPEPDPTARVFVVPAVPDFLVHTTGVAVKLSDLSDAELESVSRAWASQLRQRAVLRAALTREGQ